MIDYIHISKLEKIEDTGIMFSEPCQIVLGLNGFAEKLQ